MQTDDVVHRFDAATGAAILPDITLPSGSAFVTGIAIGPGGDLFVAASSAAQVFRYNAMTGAQIGGPFVTFNGQNDGHDVQGPEGMAFAPNGNLYVADVTLSNVHEYDTAGNSVASLDADPSAFFSQPTDVAFDAGGNLYVVNPGFADVLKSVGGTQPFAEFVSPLSGGLTIPQALTFGPDGKLYVLDASNSSGPAIRRYTAAGADDGTCDFVRDHAVSTQRHRIRPGRQALRERFGLGTCCGASAPLFARWHRRRGVGRVRYLATQRLWRSASPSRLRSRCWRWRASGCLFAVRRSRAVKLTQRPTV